jgi:hypothetical protein
MSHVIGIAFHEKHAVKVTCHQTAQGPTLLSGKLFGILIKSGLFQMMIAALSSSGARRIALGPYVAECV